MSDGVVSDGVVSADVVPAGVVPDDDGSGDDGEIAGEDVGTAETGVVDSVEGLPEGGVVAATAGGGLDETGAGSCAVGAGFVAFTPTFAVERPLAEAASGGPADAAAGA